MSVLQICTFFMKFGRCMFKEECKWNHPNVKPLKPDEPFYDTNVGQVWPRTLPGMEELMHYR